MYHMSREDDEVLDTARGEEMKTISQTHYFKLVPSNNANGDDPVNPVIEVEQSQKSIDGSLLKYFEQFSSDIQVDDLEPAGEDVQLSTVPNTQTEARVKRSKELHYTSPRYPAEVKQKKQSEYEEPVNKSQGTAKTKSRKSDQGRKFKTTRRKVGETLPNRKPKLTLDELKEIIKREMNAKAQKSQPREQRETPFLHPIRSLETQLDIISDTNPALGQINEENLKNNKSNFFESEITKKNEPEYKENLEKIETAVPKSTVFYQIEENVSCDQLYDPWNSPNNSPELTGNKNEGHVWNDNMLIQDTEFRISDVENLIYNSQDLLDQDVQGLHFSMPVFSMDYTVREDYAPKSPLPSTQHLHSENTEHLYHDQITFGINEQLFEQLQTTSQQPQSSLPHQELSTHQQQSLTTLTEPEYLPQKLTLQQQQLLSEQFTDNMDLINLDKELLKFFVMFANKSVMTVDEMSLIEELNSSFRPFRTNAEQISQENGTHNEPLREDESEEHSVRIKVVHRQLPQNTSHQLPNPEIHPPLTTLINSEKKSNPMTGLLQKNSVAHLRQSTVTNSSIAPEKNINSISKYRNPNKEWKTILTNIQSTLAKRKHSHDGQFTKSTTSHLFQERIHDMGHSHATLQAQQQLQAIVKHKDAIKPQEHSDPSAKRQNVLHSNPQKHELDKSMSLLQQFNIEQLQSKMPTQAKEQCNIQNLLPKYRTILKKKFKEKENAMEHLATKLLTSENHNQFLNRPFYKQILQCQKPLEQTQLDNVSRLGEKNEQEPKSNSGDRLPYHNKYLENEEKKNANNKLLQKRLDQFKLKYYQSLQSNGQDHIKKTAVGIIQVEDDGDTEGELCKDLDRPLDIENRVEKPLVLVKEISKTNRTIRKMGQGLADTFQSKGQEHIQESAVEMIQIEDDSDTEEQLCKDQDHSLNTENRSLPHIPADDPLENAVVLIEETSETNLPFHKYRDLPMIDADLIVPTSNAVPSHVPESPKANLIVEDLEEFESLPFRGLPMLDADFSTSAKFPAQPREASATNIDLEYFGSNSAKSSRDLCQTDVATDNILLQYSGADALQAYRDSSEIEANLYSTLYSSPGKLPEELAETPTSNIEFGPFDYINRNNNKNDCMTETFDIREGFTEDVSEMYFQESAERKTKRRRFK